MKNITQHYAVQSFTARLPITQFKHLKSMVSPSIFIRSLIEIDMVDCGVQHALS